ncbi:MAG: hypothetical protein AAGC55_22115, partial [Myxococcota bacterium]
KGPVQRAEQRNSADLSQPPAKLHQRARDLGLAMEQWRIADDRYTVVGDAPGRIRGSGTYVLRHAPLPPASPLVVLQAPHPYFEYHIADIAAHALLTAPTRQHIRGLFISSMHRYQLAPGVRRKADENPSDVCHNPDHLFSAATQALAEAGPALYVFQLHGFSERRQRDRPISGVDVIVNATAGTRSAQLTSIIAAHLQERFPDFAMRRYPDEIAELGGMTNVQRRLLRRYDHAVFVHLELSRRFRRHLAGDPAARDRLADALVRSAHGEAPSGPPAPPHDRRPARGQP